MTERGGTPLKAILYSAVVVAAALFIFRHLYTGGWLTTSYHLNDPNIVNLALALLEPMLVLPLIVYWLKPSPGWYRVLFGSFLLQLLVCLGFVLLFIFFATTWHPRLM